jgi:hypothetical protein
MKSYYLNLPYFKQGDDLAWAMDKKETDTEAFELHAEMLENAVFLLRKCADLAAENKIKIAYADTHMIGIECPEEVGDNLVSHGILGVDEWEDEEEYSEELPEYDPEDDPDLM